MRILGMNIHNNLDSDRTATAEIRLAQVSSDDINYMHHLYSCNLPCRFTINPYEYKTTQPELKIERVIFNNPATIVFWNDGTKTVVKCDENDIFSEEMGLAMACTKKLFGNNFSYFGKFDKALKKAKGKEKEDICVRTGYMVIP